MPNSPQTPEELLKLYASTIEAHYAAESKFTSDPNWFNSGEYHRSLDRLLVLREEVTHLRKFSDAAQAVEVEEMVQELQQRLDEKDRA